MYFPLLLQRKDTKGKQPENPFLRERFLARKVSRDSSKERRGNFAFDAKLLPHGWRIS